MDKIAAIRPASALQPQDNIGVRVAQLTDAQIGVLVAQASASLSHWGLSAAQRADVLDTTISSLRRWEAAAQETPRRFPGTLSKDLYTRISLILGIHKSLRILFATDGMDARFMQARNDAPLFGGQPPLQLLFGAQENMRRLRRWLDAARGV